MKNFIARISGTKDLTEGKPSKLILNFGLPLLFGLIFQQFYNMVDSVIVGQKLGTDALNCAVLPLIWSAGLQAVPVNNAIQILLYTGLTYCAWAWILRSAAKNAAMRLCCRA